MKRARGTWGRNGVEGRGMGAEGKFDHVRGPKGRPKGRSKGRPAGSNTENVFQERQRLRTAAVAESHGYMAAKPFHATFTILFYFERYIFLDFTARLARATATNEIRLPARPREPEDLLKFYTVSYLRARLCNVARR